MRVGGTLLLARRGTLQGNVIEWLSGDCAGSRLRVVGMHARQGGRKRFACWAGAPECTSGGQVHVGEKAQELDCVSAEHS